MAAVVISGWMMYNVLWAKTGEQIKGQCWEFCFDKPLSNFEKDLM